MLLGSGGMATVHLALATGQNDFSRLVVVKAVREGNAGVEELRRMFLSEARLSARLNHPNVVQVSEVVESDETVMLVMEYLDGLSLAEAYLNVPVGFTLAMRLRVLCEVLLGLHYAHELADYEGQPLGIVHRDVSPQNVFLTYDGRVKLLDFGIAKATTLANRDETREGVVKGRVAYMPVEQFTGEKTDRRADVYAVGCMIWEAVAGTRMWGNASDVEILQNVWSGTLPQLRDQVDVDDELAAIVERATAHKAEDRYPTAEALRLDLEAYLKQLPPTSARDVGQFLSDACTEQRQTKQKLIADAIANAKARTDSVSSGSLRTLVRPATTEAATVTGIERTPRRRRLLPFVLVGTIAAGIITVARRLPFGEPAAPVPVAAPPEAEAKPEPEAASLTVRPTPEDALVYLDGNPMQGMPPRLEVRPGSQHDLRVERTGYRTEQRSLLVNGDTTLEIALKAEPTGENNAAREASNEAPEPPRVRQTTVVRRPRKVVPPSPAPTKPAAKPDPCNPPFFFDKGIKTYKPECI